MSTIEIAGATWAFAVHARGRTTVADVAVVIPMHEAWPLCRLALDALRACTPGVKLSLWVVDCCSSRPTAEALCAEPDVNVIRLETAPWRRWQRPVDVGSFANGLALELAHRILPRDAGYARFVMHSDALPIDARFFPLLLDCLDWPSGQVAVAVKTDAIRAKAMHCSGFLIDSRALKELETLRPEGLWLPDPVAGLDAGDGVTIALRTRRWSYAVLPWHTHRPRVKPGKATLPCVQGGCAVPRDAWFESEDVDVSFLADGRTPAYLHWGGGSWASRARMARLERRTRAALQLPQREVVLG